MTSLRYGGAPTKSRQGIYRDKTVYTIKKIRRTMLASKTVRSFILFFRLFVL